MGNVQEVVIHAVGLENGVEVHATNVTVSYYPPPRMGPDAQDAFVQFDIEWSQGDKARKGFVALIPKEPGPQQHYVLELDNADPALAVVGLRPWSNGKPNQKAPILWARSGGDPRDWYSLD